MLIRLLGSVEVEHSGRPVRLGGPKQRAVLAMLALDVNATVSVDQLIDGLWGEAPPPTGAKMVQQYVSQLRRLLVDGDLGIATHGGGYELRGDPSSVDAVAFEQLVHRAARETDGVRGELAHAALGLWRGPPLTGLATEPFAAAEARRLSELRLAAVELTIDADLDAGRHVEVIGPLTAFAGQHPLRERLRVLLMLALYRSGRQAEALETFRDARRTLVESLGLEPGAELRRLQEAILRQDPSLDLLVPDEAWARSETAHHVEVGAGNTSRPVDTRVPDPRDG